MIRLRALLLTSISQQRDRWEKEIVCGFQRAKTEGWSHKRRSLRCQSAYFLRHGGFNTTGTEARAAYRRRNSDFYTVLTFPKISTWGIILANTEQLLSRILELVTR